MLFFVLHFLMSFCFLILVILLDWRYILFCNLFFSIIYLSTVIILSTINWVFTFMILRVKIIIWLTKQNFFLIFIIYYWNERFILLINYDLWFLNNYLLVCIWKNVLRIVKAYILSCIIESPLLLLLRTFLFLLLSNRNVVALLPIRWRSWYHITISVFQIFSLILWMSHLFLPFEVFP